VLIAALVGWGFFTGLYDANIFASIYEVVRPEARGAAAGMMNTIGWLAGGGTAPVIIGWLADQHGLSFAISITAVVYLAGALLLLLGITRFVNTDVKALSSTAAEPPR
jgi:MFS family permease